MRLWKKLLGTLVILLAAICCTDIGALTVQAAPVNFSVIYYVEVYDWQKDGSNIEVNGKFYNRIPDSTYNMPCQADAGAIISIAEETSLEPGIYVNGVKYNDTFKGYTSTLRKYSYETTMAWGREKGYVDASDDYKATVAADGSTQILLFYDWIDPNVILTSYKRLHYIELEDQSVSVFDLNVGG